MIKKAGLYHLTDDEMEDGDCFDYYTVKDVLAERESIAKEVQRLAHNLSIIHNNCDSGFCENSCILDELRALAEELEE